jgi:hypothetical protein
MINQLFIDKPPESIILTCITLLGWTSLNDKRILIRTDLDNIHVASKFIPVINDLRCYYLPCKQDKYLTNISTKSIITIVRQLLKTIGYNIKGIERVMDNKKEMIYKLELYNKLTTPLQPQLIERHINQSNNILTTQTTQSKFIVCWN